MYWSSNIAYTHAIWRANLDGSDPEIILTGLTEIAGIALDLVHDKIYRAEEGSGTIMRANLDGSTKETLATGQEFPFGIALDLSSGRMFWTVSGSNGIITSANLDGTGSRVILDGLPGPSGIAVYSSVPEPSTAILLMLGLMTFPALGLKEKRCYREATTVVSRVW